MPDINNLKKYINYATSKSGFNPDVIKKFVIDSKLHKLEPFQNNVSICLDEMKLQQVLVYKRSSGKLVGFCEMGDINQEIESFQARCVDKESSVLTISKDIAKYVNVFVVRGIYTHLESTIGYHASRGFTGDQLFLLVWEATRILKVVGFKVRSWVCDEATQNRSMEFQITLEYVITQLTGSPDKNIYFISDVPHLLKTTRNNLENLHGHMSTRNLHVSSIYWC